MRLQNYRELGGVWGARLLRNKSFGLEEANFNAKVRTACWTYGWSALKLSSKLFKTTKMWICR